ncbi:MAG TPA: hypothetical protein VM009_01340 [Terriglobales bacterium]|nr:hypothetical protein [Terriglobales bacterium]
MEMQNRYHEAIFFAQVSHSAQQSHGVRTAGNGNTDPVTWLHQAAQANALCQGLSHEMMLQL